MVVVCEGKLHVYALTGQPEFMFNIPTGPNATGFLTAHAITIILNQPPGICALSGLGSMVVACPSVEEGSIQVQSHQFVLI